MPQRSPAYLWYPKDVLSSGRVMALTNDEELWYRRALDQSWLHGGLPADPQEFAGWVGRDCTVAAAEKIINHFFTYRDRRKVDRVFNERQEKDRKAWKKTSKERSKAGVISGQVRRARSNSRKALNGLIDEQTFNSSFASSPLLSTQSETAEQFIARLKADIRYSNLDVEKVLLRAREWAEKKGRSFTRRFVMNWLDKEEPPLEFLGTRNTRTSLPSPADRQAVREAAQQQGLLRPAPTGVHGMLGTADSAADEKESGVDQFTQELTGICS